MLRLILIFFLFFPLGAIGSTEIDPRIVERLQRHSMAQKDYLDRLNERFPDGEMPPGFNASEALGPAPELEVNDLISDLKSAISSASGENKKLLEARLRQLERYKTIDDETRECGMDISCDEVPPSDCAGKKRHALRNCNRRHRSRIQSFNRCEFEKGQKIFFLQSLGIRTLNSFKGFEQCSMYNTAVRELGDFTAELEGQVLSDDDSRDLFLLKLATDSHRAGHETALMAKKVLDLYYNDGQGQPSCEELASSNSLKLPKRFLERCQKSVEFIKNDPNRRTNDQTVKELASMREQLRNIDSYGQVIGTVQVPEDAGFTQEEYRDMVRNSALQRREYCDGAIQQRLAMEYPYSSVIHKAFTEVDPKDFGGAAFDKELVSLSINKQVGEFNELMDELASDHKSALDETITYARMYNRTKENPLKQGQGLELLAKALKMNPQSTIQTLLNSKVSLKPGEFCALLKQVNENVEERKKMQERFMTVINAASIVAFAVPFVSVPAAFALRAVTTATLAGTFRGVTVKRGVEMLNAGMQKYALAVARPTLYGTVGASVYSINESYDQLLSAEAQMALQIGGPDVEREITNANQEIVSQSLALGFMAGGIQLGKFINGGVRGYFSRVRNMYRLRDRQRSQGFRESYERVGRRLYGDRFDPDKATGSEQQTIVKYIREVYGGSNRYATGYGRRIDVLEERDIARAVSRARRHVDRNKDLISRNATQNLPAREFNFEFSISPRTIAFLRRKYGNDVDRAFKVFERRIARPNINANYTSADSVTRKARDFYSKIRGDAEEIFPGDPKTQANYIQYQMENVFIRITGQMSRSPNAENTAMNWINRYMDQRVLLSRSIIKTSKVFWAQESLGEGRSRTLGLFAGYLKRNMSDDGANDEGGTSPDLSPFVNLIDDPNDRDQILDELDRELDIRSVPREEISTSYLTEVRRDPQNLSPLELADRVDQYAMTCAQ